MIGSASIGGASLGSGKHIWTEVAYLQAERGSYAIVGKGADLLYNRVLEAEKGSFAITGKDVLLQYIIATLEAQKGTFAISGKDADLLWDRVLSAQKGSYTIAGKDVDLIRGLARVKLPRISVARSGTSATVTMRNWESGDVWNLYRAAISDSTEGGLYSATETNITTASVNDTGLTSGTKYKWRAAIVALSTVQQKGKPKVSNP